MNSKRIIAILSVMLMVAVPLCVLADESNGNNVSEMDLYDMKDSTNYWAIVTYNTDHYEIKNNPDHTEESPKTKVLINITGYATQLVPDDNGVFTIPDGCGIINHDNFDIESELTIKSGSYSNATININGTFNISSKRVLNIDISKNITVVVSEKINAFIKETVQKNELTKRIEFADGTEIGYLKVSLITNNAEGSVELKNMVAESGEDSNVALQTDIDGTRLCDGTLKNGTITADSPIRVEKFNLKDTTFVFNSGSIHLVSNLLCGADVLFMGDVTNHMTGYGSIFSGYVSTESGLSFQCIKYETSGPKVQNTLTFVQHQGIDDISIDYSGLIFKNMIVMDEITSIDIDTVATVTVRDNYKFDGWYYIDEDGNEHPVTSITVQGNMVVHAKAVYVGEPVAPASGSDVNILVIALTAIISILVIIVALFTMRYVY